MDSLVSITHIALDVGTVVVAVAGAYMAGRRALLARISGLEIRTAEHEVALRIGGLLK